MRRLLRQPEALLAIALLLEVLLFSQIAEHFATPGNFLENLRLNPDVGLLPLAMSPVILTGGIDLSVGSMLGLCAVVFGKLWRDGHLPWPAAAVGAIVLGVLAGGVNASLITRLRIPALIVTLGTFSLF